MTLLAGGGKIYTDLAARFVGSERSLEEIVASPYSKEIVSRIINSGHKAALEFDYFLFGIEGYSRVTETQLVRKRMASYMIKSGRNEKGGKRSFDVVLPRAIEDNIATIKLPAKMIKTKDGKSWEEKYPAEEVYFSYDAESLLKMTELWYQSGIELGFLEEELRYLKPQATEFKAIVGMNAHALTDWFTIRCCMRAQSEIRDLANKMLKLCREAAPELFENSGAACKVLGYCPENEMQHPNCKGKIVTKRRALEIISMASKNA